MLAHALEFYQGQRKQKKSRTESLHVARVGERECGSPNRIGRVRRQYRVDLDIHNGWGVEHDEKGKIFRRGTTKSIEDREHSS